jgi:hypothetical protein
VTGLDESATVLCIRVTMYQPGRSTQSPDYGDVGVMCVCGIVSSSAKHGFHNLSLQYMPFQSAEISAFLSFQKNKILFYAFIPPEPV